MAIVRTTATTTTSSTGNETGGSRELGNLCGGGKHLMLFLSAERLTKLGMDRERERER